MTANPHTDAPSGDPHDWVDGLLLRDAAEAADYLDDGGFTARVLGHLPPVRALPAWRRPVIMLLWLVAAAFAAIALPGLAVEVARAVYRVFAALPFSLSSLAFAIVALGVATWTAAVFALRRA
jgi:hypothetical protein